MNEPIADDGAMKAGDRDSWKAWYNLLGTAVFLGGLVGSLMLISRGQGELQKHLIDAYYYFEAAENIRESGLPTIDWPQGPQNKFFPGYSYLLAVASLLTFRAPEAAWALLNLGLVVAIVALIARLFYLWGLPFAQALAGAGLAAGNVVFMRWAAVPYSETFCLLCLLGQAVLFSERRIEKPEGVRQWLEKLTAPLVGILAGAAVATRIEAAFFQPFLLLLDYTNARRFWFDWKRLTMWAVLGLGPLLLWVVWLQTSGEQLHYVGEGAGLFQWEATLMSLATLQTTNVYYWQFDAPNLPLQMGFMLFWLAFMAMLFVAPRGFLGRRAQVLWCVLLVYWLAHSLWYYASERYNVHVMPLVYFLMLQMFAKYAWPEAPAEAHRSRMAWLYWALCLTVLVLQWNGGYIIREHTDTINQGLSDEAYRKLSAELPRGSVVLTDESLALAHLHDGRVWFASDKKAFWTGMAQNSEISTGDFLLQAQVQFVVLEQPLDNFPDLLQIRGNESGLRLEPILEDKLLVYEVLR